MRFKQLIFPAILLLLFSLPGCNQRVFIHKQCANRNIKITKASDALVQIECGEQESNGVLVSGQGIILTVSHGITGSEPVVHLSNGQSYEADILYRHQEFDLGILKLKQAPSTPFIEIGENSSIHQQVFLVGISPGKRRIIYNKGRILMKGVNIIEKGGVSTINNAGQNSDNIYQNSIVHSCRCKIGCSGSALISADGKLLGINTAILGKPQDKLTIAIDSNNFNFRLNKYLEKNRIKGEILPPEVPILDSVSAKLDWILNGLVNHGVNSGYNRESLLILKQNIKQEIIELVNNGKLSENRAPILAWKNFMDELPGI